MLDQMSGGRLELGIGRGTSPLEAALFNSDHQQSAPRYAEALEVILKGLTHKTLSHEGAFYRYKDVPIELSPLQQPHPPLWIGGHSVDGAARAAKLGANYVTQDTAEATRPYMDSYRAAWKEASPGKNLPKLGLLRFIVVADSDAAAEKLARRAYPKWHAAYDHLHKKHGLVHERGARTADFGVTFDQQCPRRLWQPGQSRARAAPTGRDRRHQLLRRAILVRRSQRDRSRALDRAFRQRGHAGAARALILTSLRAKRSNPEIYIRSWIASLRSQ